MHYYTRTLLVALYMCYSVVSYAQPDTAIVWQTALGGTNEEVPFSMQLCRDKGFVIVSSTNSDDGDLTGNYGRVDIWLTKLDADGKLSWQYSFGGSGDDYPACVRERTDGYIIAGTTSSTNGDVTLSKGYEDAWVIFTDDKRGIKQKTYGGSGRDFINDMTETEDSAYILTGVTSSVDGDVTVNKGREDIWVLKLATDGTLLWQNTYGGSGRERGIKIVSASDGYIITGISDSKDGDMNDNHGHVNFFIMKISKTGELLWERNISDKSIATELMDIKPANDNGYIVCMNIMTDSVDVNGRFGGSDILIIKTDSNGYTQWEKVYGSATLDGPGSIITTRDGGYIISGYTGANNSNAPLSSYYINAWNIKLDINGNVQWKKISGGNENDYARYTVQTDDGGYVCAGYVSSSNIPGLKVHSGADDLWIYKIGGNEAQTNNDPIKIYPIPATTTVYIEGIKVTTRVQLYDMAGREVLTGRLNDYKSSIYIGNLAAGMYFMALTDTKGDRTMYKIERL